MEKKSDTASMADDHRLSPPSPSEEKATGTFITPPGLTDAEFLVLKTAITEFHTYDLKSAQCSSLLAQHVDAPPDVVWSVIRQFDKPQIYKHFIKSCSVKEGSTMAEGCTRDVIVISGLPAATSTERLDLLDDERQVMAFTIIGGEHRLRNYRAVTTVHEIKVEGSPSTKTIVLESYMVDVPEGNTEEDTRFFADTVVKLNLQKLASVTEAIARGGAAAVESLW
ncbi:abscisic acid receptor PYR1-like [Cynara cardunculus var. scolymus]|uniref:Polyketide cyclase/dehydrase n=1 Tax=Cynara cardunculus var. scolymus TaxID=59895 RepID=A0A118JT22_CYNCS|nr:abscisic acid receptor PYR1-like [Cynara cardunculus var. scolymus]KVH89742.1 Polyketide cyclase/dehydrase [Cynara cardunculus var. scolymus]